MSSTAASSAPSSLTPRASKQEIQAAIAKVMELRALHSALLHGGGSINSGIVPPQFHSDAAPSSSVSRVSVHFSAEDYPVFTPSYGRNPLPDPHFPQSQPLKAPENFRCSMVGEAKRDDQVHSESKRPVGFPSLDLGEHVNCLDDQLSHMSSFFTRSNGVRISRRSHSGDFGSSTTCNQCPDATLSNKGVSDRRSPINANQATPVAQTSEHLHPKQRRNILSWLFLRGKKKTKSEMSPSTAENDNMSQLLKDWGMFSLESLKKELLKANEKRDAALSEVSEMKSSLGDLQKKMVTLETYCDELKNALKQANQESGSQSEDRARMSKRSKSIGSGGSRDNSLPVSDQVMAEGFLQIVSEARLSLKQFSKAVITQVDESDAYLMEKLNSLHPHRTSSRPSNAKRATYHLEAIINQSLFEDFENCVFQKCGCPKFLDPRQDRQESFSAFVSLRNLSWNEVLKKGTKCYSEDFTRFCNHKMSGIVSTLNWSKPWTENLLQPFFTAAKCVWLLHLLAFSFHPPLMIFRVDENRDFDPLYMEDVLPHEKQQPTPKQVKVMVLPGFYIQGKVLRCRVLCI